jgi:hypothetical protein
MSINICPFKGKMEGWMENSGGQRPGSKREAVLHWDRTSVWRMRKFCRQMVAMVA